MNAGAPIKYSIELLVLQLTERTPLENMLDTNIWPPVN